MRDIVCIYYQIAEIINKNMLIYSAIFFTMQEE